MAFAALSEQLLALKTRNDSALKSAVAQSSRYADALLKDAIFERYNFSDKGYLEQHMELSVDHNAPEFRVSARMRKSNAINFMDAPQYRASKVTAGKQVLAGYTGAFLRGKLSHWRGAFIFKGQNGNMLMAYRQKGDKNRKIPGISYGPSVAGALAVVKDDATAQVMQHIAKLYRKQL